MLLRELRVFSECEKAARRGQTTKEEAKQLSALVSEISEHVKPLLARIPLTFGQYTNHDLDHSLNLIELMGRIVPHETLGKLNALELAMAMLAALLHDTGMYVTDDEKQAFLTSEEYRHYLLEHDDRVAAAAQAREQSLNVKADMIETALFAEFIRRRHARRARVFIAEHYGSRLVFRSVNFTDDLCDLCESHAWPARTTDAANPKQTVQALETDRRLGAVSVNLQYLGCLLRLADILDFDRSRTPLVVYEEAQFTEEKSWEEWNKHLAVTGWAIESDRIRFDVECAKPVFYVAVQEFLGWVDAELRDCRYLVDEAPRTVAKHYELQLPVAVDRRRVGMKDKRFVAGAFHFSLDYERIMQLLMDRSLYPDPNMCLRELLQNSLDACRVADARARGDLTERERKSGAKPPYEARIVVWDHSGDAKNPRVIFQDNGVGMSQRTVEEYFLRVGKSYYRSREFEAERAKLQKKSVELEAISQFGIGILSCFLLADRFEVHTYREGSDPLKITVEGPTKYFTIERLDRVEAKGKPKTDEEAGPLGRRPGTRVTLFLRDGVETKVRKTLETYAVNLEYEVRVHQDTAGAAVLPPWRWERRELVADSQTLVLANYAKSALPALASILVPSRIPFEEYDYAKHIKGCVWLWLLKGRQGPRLVQGYLKIDAYRGLRVGGAPEVLENLIDSAKDDDVSYYDNAAEFRESYSDWFENLSSDEGDAVAEVAMRRLERKRDPRKHWYEDLSVLSSLRKGSVDAIRPDIDYGLGVLDDDPVDERRQPRKVALHGVLVPGGISGWSPGNSQASEFSLLPLPSFVSIDVRGAKAPRPAASRMFIEIGEESRELRRIILKATADHLTSLQQSHSLGLSKKQFIKFVQKVQSIDKHERSMSSFKDLSRVF